MSEGLNKSKAKNNLLKAGKGLLKITKIYGPTALKIALVVYLLPESVLVDGTLSPSPLTLGSQVAPVNFLGIGASKACLLVVIAIL